VDKVQCSHAFKQVYIGFAQEIAGDGDGKAGGKRLGLPKETPCFEDYEPNQFWIYVGLYVVIMVAALFTQPYLGLIMLLWPVFVVMMFFPKGRKWLKDAWNSPGGSSGSYSSSYDRDYSSSSYSSSSSSSSDYGGGSFGGGGADR
jgi:uncharacterized membrane protein YgcG